MCTSPTYPFALQFCESLVLGCSRDISIISLLHRAVGELKAVISRAVVKTIWLKSRKWKRDDLDGKLVEFRITYPDAVAEGMGRFIMRGNGAEKLAADIVVPHPREYYDNYYHLTDALFEKIEMHPNRSRADFRVFGLFDPSMA